MVEEEEEGRSEAREQVPVHIGPIRLVVLANVHFFVLFVPGHDNRIGCQFNKYVP